MRRFALVTAVLFGVVIAAAAAIAVITSATGAGASRASAARLATRFLIVAGTKYDYSTARLEIVARHGGLIRLVADQGGMASASLSPDRTLVAWQGAGGIQVENVDGSDSRLLVPCEPVCYVGMPFVWSPDSQKLLIRDADKGLAIVSVATGAVHEIVPPQANVRYFPIAWSRPAHKILFMASGAPVPGKDLVVASPSGASQRTIYHSRWYEPIASIASWSPNGKWVSFTSEGSPRLAIVNMATGATKRVRNFRPVLLPPVWAPNSSRFAIGRPQRPIGLFSPAGKRLGSLKPTSADVRAWTRGGIYIKSPFDVGRRLLVIPHGQQKPRTVFTLPKGKALWEVQPF